MHPNCIQECMLLQMQEAARLMRVMWLVCTAVRYQNIYCKAWLKSTLTLQYEHNMVLALLAKGHPDPPRKVSFPCVSWTDNPIICQLCLRSSGGLECKQYANIALETQQLPDQNSAWAQLTGRPFVCWSTRHSRDYNCMSSTVSLPASCQNLQEDNASGAKLIDNPIIETDKHALLLSYMWRSLQ